MFFFPSDIPKEKLVDAEAVEQDARGKKEEEKRRGDGSSAGNGGEKHGEGEVEEGEGKEKEERRRKPTLSDGEQENGETTGGSGVKVENGEEAEAADKEPRKTESKMYNLGVRRWSQGEEGEDGHVATYSGGSVAMSSLSADEILPALIYAVLRCNPPHLKSNLKYIRHFRRKEKVR